MFKVGDKVEHFDYIFFDDMPYTVTSVEGSKVCAKGVCGSKCTFRHDGLAYHKTHKLEEEYSLTF